MKKLFKTVTKNGKTYKVNRIGTWICPNCLGVDGCMCALKPKSTPSPVEEAVKELEHLWNNRNDGGGLDSSYDEFEALLRSLAASVRRETLEWCEREVTGKDEIMVSFKTREELGDKEWFRLLAERDGRNALRKEQRSRLAGRKGKV